MNTTVSSINDKSIKRHEVMTGLSAGNIGAFIGQFSQGNDLTSDIGEKNLSVDQDYFHRTFDIQDGEKGNKDRRDEIREEQILAQKEREEDANNLGDAVEAVTQELREKLEEKIRLGNGFDIDPEVLRKINKKYRDQVEGKTNAELAQTAEEEGISVEWLLLRADIAEDIDTNGYDRAKLVDKWGEENVDRYEDNVKHEKQQMDADQELEQKHKAQAQTLEKQTVSSEIIEQDFEDDMDLLADLGIDTPSSLAASIDEEKTDSIQISGEFTGAVQQQDTIRIAHNQDPMSKPTVTEPSVIVS